MIKFLREQGGELKWDEGKESSELCELARAGDLERVKLLLDCGCSANAADYDRCASTHGPVHVHANLFHAHVPAGARASTSRAPWGICASSPP